jgi:sodium-dependent phosphate transporter
MLTHPFLLIQIVVLGIIFGFFMAFGIGANDVANAFGSSVSAGSLSLGWAIILGTAMEFAGSMLIGASVTSTIRSKIIFSSFYQDEPQVLMFGMLCALMVGSVWLFIATSLQFPVSTTHDIIAAIIGFSLAAHGFASVDWHQTGLVFASWFAAPAFAGIISSLFFKTLLETVLKSNDIFERALKTFPLVVFIGVTVNMFFILDKSKNNKRISVDNYKTDVELPGSLGSGFVCAVITYFCLVPYLRRHVTAAHDERMTSLDAATKQAQLEAEDTEATANKEPDKDAAAFEATAEPGRDAPNAPATFKEEPKLKPSRRTGIIGLWDLFAENTFRQDLKTESLQESHRAASIWAAQHVYDMKTEHLFSYLQIFTACMASFAHGGNDVANAIAPVSAILSIYFDGKVSSKSEVQKWLLAMGGAGISLGFLLYGYKIIKAVGYKLTAITPSRGFCIELAAALSVSLASYLRLPVSTTQCLVGATCGVGLASGGLKNVEWYFLLRTMCGWAGMFFVVCIVNAGFFSFSAYSPKV